MGIRKEINDMIIERGGTPPVNGGIAASIDALSKLLNVGGGSGSGGITTLYLNAFGNTKVAYKDETATVPFDDYEELKSIFINGTVRIKQTVNGAFYEYGLISLPIAIAFDDEQRLINVNHMDVENVNSTVLRFSDYTPEE